MAEKIEKFLTAHALPWLLVTVLSIILVTFIQDQMYASAAVKSCMADGKKDYECYALIRADKSCQN